MGKISVETLRMKDESCAWSRGVGMCKGPGVNQTRHLKLTQSQTALEFKQNVLNVSCFS